MLFGLCNAAATCQRMIHLRLYENKYGNLIMCYADDVVIGTLTEEHHKDRLDEVFLCIKQGVLKCKPSNCETLRDSIEYLGHLVDKQVVRPDPEAVEAVLT